MRRRPLSLVIIPNLDWIGTRARNSQISATPYLSQSNLLDLNLYDFFNIESRKWRRSLDFLCKINISIQLWLYSALVQLVNRKDWSILASFLENTYRPNWATNPKTSRSTRIWQSGSVEAERGESDIRSIFRVEEKSMKAVDIQR